MTIGEKTIYVGDRRSFIKRLQQVLVLENAVPMERCRQVIGANVVIRSEVHLADGVIYIDDDRLLGKSISGPPLLVDRIAMLTFGVKSK